MKKDIKKTKEVKEETVVEAPKVEKVDLFLEGIIKKDNGYLVMVGGEVIDECIGSNAFSEAVKKYKVLALGR